MMADLAAGQVDPSEEASKAGSAGASDEPEWTLVIRPKGRWFDLRLGELWQGRELVWLFFWRDFVAPCKQIVLAQRTRAPGTAA